MNIPKTSKGRMNKYLRLTEQSERKALEHALHMGALLHWTKAQLPAKDWQPWLRENCSGSDPYLMHQCMMIARAYTVCPTRIWESGSIEAAFTIAQSVRIRSDLPAVLPGLMEPPEEGFEPPSVSP